MEDKKNENPLVAEFAALNPTTAEETTQQIMENAKKNMVPDNIKVLAAELEKEVAEQKLETAVEKVEKAPKQGAMENMKENKVEEPVKSQQSSIDLPLEAQASVDSQEVDEATARVVNLAQDIRNYTSQPGAISMVLKALCERVPEIFPNYRSWGGTDPIPFMHTKIQAPGYVEALMNSLFLMLQDNIWNVRWTAQVVIGMTVTLVMLDMPQFLYEAQLRKEQEDHPVIVEEKPKLWLPGQIA